MKNSEATETVSDDKKKRNYKISEEDREKRRERGKALALKKAEKIKENKEKKKKQVTYRDYVSVVNDLVSSASDQSSDEEVDIPPPKPVVKVKGGKNEKPVVEKIKVDDNTKIITPPEADKPKEKSISDIMKEAIKASGIKLR